MELLKETIKDFSDEELINQYLNHRGEYTPEAFSTIEEEVNSRNIDKSLLEKKPEVEIKRGQLSLDSDDFIEFENTFSRSDLMMAISILKEHGILFYADNPNSVDFIPLESELLKRFSIHVHKEHTEKAHQLLDEHFEKVGSDYLSKYCGTKDQLKSFNFHDIHISEKEAKELIDVEFSSEELEVITNYGQRLLAEVETIEKQRVVFFYDSVEPLLELLQKNADKLTRTDLLTVLEILQIYCDDPQFPEFMDEAIMTLLSFFNE
ncbi:MAG: hypothetical protein GX267_16355 [Fibrobacter sp.]|jgi:hypothetical protein|nr:hypothetical protein [Fibrobacter sp.]